MLRLASGAMAQLAVQRLLSAELVLHLPAMTAGFVACIEILVRLMDLVWSTLLPLWLWVLARLAFGLMWIHRDDCCGSEGSMDGN